MISKRINIYISGPITGLTREESNKNFLEGKEKAKQLFSKFYNEVNIINPLEKKCNVEDGFTYEEVMHIDFACIDVCDIIILLPKWENSKGAQREINYGLSKVKKVIVLEKALDYLESEEIKANELKKVLNKNTYEYEKEEREQNTYENKK